MNNKEILGCVIKLNSTLNELNKLIIQEESVGEYVAVLKNGSKIKGSMRHIANMLGVHVSNVSRLFNDKSNGTRKLVGVEIYRNLKEIVRVDQKKRGTVKLASGPKIKNLSTKETYPDLKTAAKKLKVTTQQLIFHINGIEYIKQLENVKLKMIADV